MDDLKSKFKSLLSKTANTANQITAKKFSGQGHRLGTAEERGEQPKQPRQGTSVLTSAPGSNASRRAPGGDKTKTLSTSGTTAVDQQGASSNQIQPSAQHLQPATDFSPFTAVIGSGAALGANRTTTDAAAANGPGTLHASTPTTAAATTSNRTRDVTPVSSSCLTHQQQQQQQMQHVPVTPNQVEVLQHSLVLIASQPESAATTLQTLQKLLHNLSGAPQEAKYRQLRLSNPKIHQYIVQVSGALQFLAAVGFQVHNAGSTAVQDNVTGEDDGFAVFLDDNMLGLVHEGLKQIQCVLPAVQAAEQQDNPRSVSAPSAVLSATAAIKKPLSPSLDQLIQSAPGSSVPAPAAGVVVPQITRDTQVLLPASPDVEVPDWFFERTGAELKADYMSMLRRRQSNEVIASRSWKEAQLGKKAGPKPTVAIVRVRFPEGVCLQGRFHVAEPVTAVFEWTTGALRDPTLIYELIHPNRRQLTASGFVRDADLAPAVLLNFRPMSQQGHGCSSTSQQQSYLKNDLLLQARAD